MAKAAHTPGPWVVGPVDDTVVTHLGADGNRYEVAAIDGDYNQPDEWPVMEANARLIAASPELVDRAQQLLSSLDGGSSIGIAEASSALRAVIAKALGK